MKTSMRKLSVLSAACAVALLSACDNPSTSSGVQASAPGTNVPAAFSGTYRGSATYRIEALGFDERQTDQFTVIVNGNVLTFQGDDAGENFTVGLQADGTFAGNYRLNVDDDDVDCEGIVSVEGQIIATSITGRITGDGECEFGISDVDLDISGSLNAVKVS